MLDRYEDKSSEIEPVTPAGMRWLNDLIGVACWCSVMAALFLAMDLIERCYR